MGFATLGNDNNRDKDSSNLQRRTSALDVSPVLRTVHILTRLSSHLLHGVDYLYYTDEET